MAKGLESTEKPVVTKSGTKRKAEPSVDATPAKKRAASPKKIISSKHLMTLRLFFCHLGPFDLLLQRSDHICSKIFEALFASFCFNNYMCITYVCSNINLLTYFLLLC